MSCLRPFLCFVVCGITLLTATSHAAVTAEFVPASTRRIVQLTGDYDPERIETVNRTTEWGVDGVDLGANAELDGKLFFFFGDVPLTQHPRLELSNYPPHDADLVAYTQDACPSPNGIRLTPVLRRDGVFDPFQIRFHAQDTPIPLLTHQTPTGAFGYDGRAYVFVVRKLPEDVWVSYLTSSSDPARSAVFDVQFELSRGESAKFLQVAPCVVQNAEIPGLPSREGSGLVMIGHAGQGVHLAWLPLQPGRRPDRAQIRYWTGDPHPSRRWSPPGREDQAARLFSTKHTWTSLSVGRIKETGNWLLLYQKAFRPNEDQDPEGPIVARVAAAPWELSQANEVVIFDPIRERALGRYMHSPGKDDPSRWPPVFPGQPKGFAYGAFLLNRYTAWNAREQIVTIWYLMSTFSPYQVQLMRSQIRITPSSH